MRVYRLSFAIGILVIISLVPLFVFSCIGNLTTAAGYPVIIPVTFQTWIDCLVLLIILRGGK